MLPETESLPAPKRKSNGGGGRGGRGQGGWVRGANGHWTVPIDTPIDRKWLQADVQVGVIGVIS